MRKLISLLLIINCSPCSSLELSNVFLGALGAVMGVGIGAIAVTSIAYNKIFEPNNPNLLRPSGVAVNKSGRLVALMGGYSNITSTDGGSTWIWPKKDPINNDLYGITANSSGTFLAVGDGGRIIASKDGQTWNDAINSGTNKSLYAIAAGTNGRLVVVGQNAIVTSKDSRVWKNVNSPTGNGLLGVVANSNSKFVAVGDNGAIITSEDGTTWTAAASNTTEGLKGVAVNSNGKFVAVGKHGIILISENGSIWTKVKSHTRADLYAIVANSNGRFVAVGDTGTIVTSNDGGISWTTVGADSISESYNLVGITTNRDNKFVANGFIADSFSFYMFISPDGISWTKVQV